METDNGDHMPASSSSHQRQRGAGERIPDEQVSTPRPDEQVSTPRQSSETASGSDAMETDDGDHNKQRNLKRSAMKRQNDEEEANIESAARSAAQFACNETSKEAIEKALQFAINEATDHTKSQVRKHAIAYAESLPSGIFSSKASIDEALKDGARLATEYAKEQAAKHMTNCATTKQTAEFAINFAKAHVNVHGIRLTQDFAYQTTAPVAGNVERVVQQATELLNKYEVEEDYFYRAINDAAESIMKATIEKVADFPAEAVHYFVEEKAAEHHNASPLLALAAVAADTETNVHQGGELSPLMHKNPALWEYREELD